MPVRFSDVIIGADGALSYDGYYTEVVGETSLEFDWFDSVPGYETAEVMYTELITANMTDYNCE
jgi:hypothetical protein